MSTAWVAEWYTRESQKLVTFKVLRVRVSPQAPAKNSYTIDILAIDFYPRHKT